VKKPVEQRYRHYGIGIKCAPGYFQTQHQREVRIIKIPLQITFKNMAPSEVIETHVREAAKKLESFYGEIMGCRVMVEAPHQHHRKGKQYHIRIDLTVPGGEFVIKRAPRLITDRPSRFEHAPDEVALQESRELSKYSAHDDIRLSIRDAFDAARRKLQDYARRRRGVLKLHEGSPHARVSKLFPDEGFGFLETPDGREIYFHENSVLDSGFGGLKIGTEVHFAEEPGEKGPQATTVVPVTHHGR
jgi:cold shock CspA family protein